MSKQDAHKPADGDDPAGSRPTGAGKGPPQDAPVAIHEHIGRELRAMFQEVVAQPVPEKLRQLLEKLERGRS